MKLSEFIPRGKKNAISNAALARALKTTERDVREIVQQARLEGLPVCSGMTGYYMPASVSEAEEYYHQQITRAKNGLRVLEPVKNYIDEQRRNWSQMNISDAGSEAAADER